MSGKFTPYSLSPPLAGNSRAPVAATEPFSADAAIGFHPSEFALHRLRPTQSARLESTGIGIAAPAGPRCYATRRRHELAPLHSITLSAPASSVAGTVSPRAFAGLEVDR